MLDSIVEVLKKTVEEKPTETLIATLVIIGIFAIKGETSRS